MIMTDAIIDNVVKRIQLDEIELEQFAAEVDKDEDRELLLESIRIRLVDESYVNERSIYCGLIREFNDKKSLPILWELIAKDETKGRRGSLVFAMENMNPIEYLEQLVELAITDNYEVLCNSIDIIDSLEGYIDGNTLESCISKLKLALTNSMPDWRREVLTLLLEEFEEE